MALTEPEKNKILRYLCWPLESIVEGTVDYYFLTARQINITRTDAQLAEIRDVLDSIKNLDARRVKGQSRAGVKRIGDIELNAEQELSILNKERARLQGELSDLIGIPSLCSGGRQSCVRN